MRQATHSEPPQSDPLMARRCAAPPSAARNALHARTSLARDAAKAKVTLAFPSGVVTGSLRPGNITNAGDGLIMTPHHLLLAGDMAMFATQHSYLVGAFC